jgi:D-sedoheptulose 7-phosphate isomerase
VSVAEDGLTVQAVYQAFEARVAPGQALARQAGPIADACHAMAQRFHQGGKLIVFGNGESSTDAQHVAVEFVHPAIVGKRALPAMSLTNDVATLTGSALSHGFDNMFAAQLGVLAGPEDIALGITPDGHCRNVLRALEEARRRGLLTIAMAGGDGGAVTTGGAAAGAVVDHLLLAPAGNPRLVKELQVTTYHVLWELVHVFFERPGLLDPRGPR